MLRLEACAINMLCHMFAERGSILQRMQEVKAGKDACPGNSVQPISRVLEGVRMNAVFECQAVGHHMHFGRSEEVCDQMRNSGCNAGVSGRIFGMIGRCAERCPGCIGGRFRISAARLNRSDGAPEIVGVLSVETANGLIRVSGPQEGHHACGIR